MQNVTIGFLGAGNMAGSLIGGLISAGHPADKIWASTIDPEKDQALVKKFGIHLTTDNKIVASHAEVLIFAVKPNTVKEVALEIAPLVQTKQPLVVSVAGGIREQDLRRWISEDLAVVRCMPNTPALINTGATALFANKKVTEAQKNLAESILRAVGITVWLQDELQLDAVTALSGSGPAYFFLVMEAMEQAGVELGLTPEIARLLTLQTALGAAKMAVESDKSLTQLRENVTSPGGTTEQALRVLQSGNLIPLFKDALMAAKNRAHELAQIFGI